MCKICKTESDAIKQYIQNNGLKFGTNSEIGRKWQQKVNSFQIDSEQKSKTFVDFNKELMM